MMPYDIMDLGQHWLRLKFGTSQHQATAWGINADVS